MSISQKILRKIKSESKTKFNSYVSIERSTINIALNTHSGINEKVASLVDKHVEPAYVKGRQNADVSARAATVAKELEKKLGNEIEALEADFQKKLLQKVEAAAKELGAAWKV